MLEEVPCGNGIWFIVYCGGMKNLHDISPKSRRSKNTDILHSRKGITFDTSQSENQRINPQRRKKDSPLPPGKKLGCLPWGVVVEDRADLGTQVRQVKMGQDKGLQLDNQMFVGRKNIVVGELDLAVEVLAAALGIIMECLVLLKVCFGSFVLMFMVEAVHTLVCHYAKTAHKLVVFGTIVEFHVPPDRYEQHREGQQKGADLQQPIFHSFISPKSLSSSHQF